MIDDAGAQCELAADGRVGDVDAAATDDPGEDFAVERIQIAVRADGAEADRAQGHGRLCRGRGLGVRAARGELRADHEALQNREIIPWLTAGTYGEFASPLMEPMVLETILNGARGLTYYEFRDFDPLDFYYHARALATLP